MTVVEHHAVWTILPTCQWRYLIYTNMPFLEDVLTSFQDSSIAVPSNFDIDVSFQDS